MKLSRLRDDSRLARRVLLSSFVAVLLAAVVTTGILAWVMPWQRSSAGSADRLAETGDVLAAGTLLLAFIAAIVAVAAYAVATGLPALEFTIKFDPSQHNNRPVFWMEKVEKSWAPIESSSIGRAAIFVRNVSGYSARNPAVIIRLNGMMAEMDHDTEWVSVGSLLIGKNAFQWDGGPTYSIHGHSMRRLPDLRFSKVSAIFRVPGHYSDEGSVTDALEFDEVPTNDPSFTIELLAEGGYRREITIPVLFKGPDRSWPKHPVDTQPGWL